MRVGISVTSSKAKGNLVFMSQPERIPIIQNSNIWQQARLGLLVNSKQQCAKRTSTCHVLGQPAPVIRRRRARRPARYLLRPNERQVTNTNKHGFRND